MPSQDHDVRIDTALVRALIASQFPQWQALPVQPVTSSGWDNRTFHLGDDMLVRLPSRAIYASQVEKEQKWLPIIAPQLPFAIPHPIAIGSPSDQYPWRWSIYRYLPGTTLATANIPDPCLVANDLARFLTAFEQIDATGGPVAGEHSFHRGGALSVYDTETRRAISLLKDKIDTNLVTSVWENAIKTTWQNKPVWVHGDISSGNLLVSENRLSAVIDFGQLAVGDPACDLAITWTFFKDKSRDAFREAITFDSGTWARARAWTLWKALIVAANLTNTSAVEASKSWQIIDDILEDHLNAGE